MSEYPSRGKSRKYDLTTEPGFEHSATTDLEVILTQLIGKLDQSTSKRIIMNLATINGLDGREKERAEEKLLDELKYIKRSHERGHSSSFHRGGRKSHKHKNYKRPKRFRTTRKNKK